MSCDSLSEIEIPASVEEIAEESFLSCESLARVTFASGTALKRLGEQAFLGCVSLEEVDLPDSLTYVAANAFDSCPNLTDLPDLSDLSVPD